MPTSGRKFHFLCSHKFLSTCYESPCCQTPLENVDEPGTVFSQRNLLLVQKSSLLVSCFLLACNNCPHSSPQSYRGSSLMQFSCYMMKIFFFPPSIYQTKWPSQKVFLRLMIYHFGFLNFTTGNDELICWNFTSISSHIICIFSLFQPQEKDGLNFGQLTFPKRMVAFNCSY